MVSAREPKGLRIFIVEDHSDSLSALETYLSECGHVVRHARTLADTEERLSQNSCDVLLSDIGLPDGDGWELLDRLRKAGTLPKYAIAMSGFGMFSERRKSTAAGYRRHLIKPLNPDDLDAALAEAQGELSSGG
jgi:CheY-like chemotaxis protein